MEMSLLSPTKILLPNDSDAVKHFLTFADTQVGFQLSKLRQNYRWAKSNPVTYQAQLDLLKAQQKKCLLFYTPAGQPYTYSGLWQDLQNKFGWEFKPPTPDFSDMRSIPWQKIPDTSRYYQKEAVIALLQNGHASIELPTGSGKSLILLNLAKEIPVKTIIVTPFAATTNQLYDTFVKHFGKKFVGMYGDGKHEIGKLFTVAVAASMTRILPGTEAWEEFSQCECLMWDESHTTPAETFESVCMGVAEHAKFKYFVSATQLRADGADMLLKGITGPIVYSKPFKDLVEEGYLARPVFKLFTVAGYGSQNKNDTKQETRAQLYENPNVNQLIGEIACKAVKLANRQTLIMIEEFKQFMVLKNFISEPFEFVHGGAPAEVKKFLPQEYWKPDVAQAVENFNTGKTKLLIGTSAISTGVDLKPVGCLIYAQGGKSEVKVRQAVGRGTRICSGKTDFWVIDFNVRGSNAMQRHSNIRKEIYETMGNVEQINR